MTGVFKGNHLLWQWRLKKINKDITRLIGSHPNVEKGMPKNPKRVL
jgi:hypothetical protein